LAPIEKVLGLALKLNLTMLGPAMKPGPIAFGRESNAPPPKLQFLTKKKTQQRNAPQGSTIFITQIILFLIWILLIIVKIIIFITWIILFFILICLIIVKIILFLTQIIIFFRLILLIIVQIILFITQIILFLILILLIIIKIIIFITQIVLFFILILLIIIKKYL